MKTNELVGAALDWAVAEAEGFFKNDMARITDGVPSLRPCVDRGKQRQGVPMIHGIGQRCSGQPWSAPAGGTGTK